MADFKSMNPQRSLTAAVVWLIVALAATFSISAAVWVGRLARADILQQHIRRLTLETEQLSSDVSQALTSRIDALHGAESAGDARQIFDAVLTTHPELAWLAASDAAGVIVAAQNDFRIGDDVSHTEWFAAAARQPWLGQLATQASPAPFGDVAIAVRTKDGRLLGVVAAHLSWRRAPGSPARLTDDPDPAQVAQALVLNRDGVVMLGPDGMRGKRWPGAALDGSAFDISVPQFQRLPTGQPVLVARAPLTVVGELGALGWQVQLSEPNLRVFQRGNALGLRILWVSLGLGLGTAVIGAFGARQLTRRLRRLTRSVGVGGGGDAPQIEVPAGQDEVAQLGRAFAAMLASLAQERSELKSLSQELERRVEVRTREVERLAEESRYSAIVRERLKIARDLHDTLAHSMMAMLSEIRFLRKLQVRDPTAVAEELLRAEAAAQQGLQEARGAITQMRGNAARDTGLGAALAAIFELFIDRTGLSGEFSADPAAARFGDERADTLLRMAQEALRNVQQHAQATRVSLQLNDRSADELELLVEDNGVGFDPHALPSGHYGLVGLAEQAELIGATLLIDSVVNRGTLLSICLRIAPVTFKTPPGSA